LAQLNKFVVDLKAVGEPTRLRLLSLLALSELSVKDLTQILGQSQPRISRHLKLLVDSGLVVRHAEGAWAYFGICSNSVKSHFVYSLLKNLDIWDEQIQSDRRGLKLLQEKQKQKAEKYFSAIASDWDLIRSLHVSEELVEAEIIASLGVKKYEMMIDLGTGTGRMLELLKANYKKAIGIDFSKEMISLARSRLVDNNISNAQIRLGDIVALDEYENIANLAIIHQVLHFFDDPGQVLLAAREVLQPKGEMLIVDFAPHEFNFLAIEHEHKRLGISEQQIQSWAKKAGLEVVMSKEIPNGKDASGLTVCIWVLKDNR